jgi:hypothetical protein
MLKDELAGYLFCGGSMKELIEKRIEDLMAQGKNLETQIHMISGAIQQCQWQLAELEKQDASKEIDEQKSV